MRTLLVSSNALLDVFEDGSGMGAMVGGDARILQRHKHALHQSVIYAEILVGFQRIEELEAAITDCGARMLQIPKEALFLAAKVFVEYRRRKGIKL